MKKINILTEGIRGKTWSNSCGGGLQDVYGKGKLNLVFIKTGYPELADDTFFLFPISIGDYRGYLGIGDDEFDKVESFLDIMNSKIKNLIKNKNGYILINRFAEGHITQGCYRDLHNELIKHDIPGNKVMLVSSNMNGKKQYQTFCKNMPNLTKTKITVIEAAHRLESAVITYNQIVDDDYNKDLYTQIWPYKNSFFTKKEMKDMRDTLREKYFLSYNRIIREYRLALVAMLYELGLQDKGIISLGAPKVNKEYGGVWPNRISDFIEDKKQNEVVSNAVANIKSLYPINADKDIIPELQYTEEGERIGGAVGDYTHFSHQYKRIYFNIVTESCYYEDCIYFSEKTFRPISQLTPFLFVGTSFSLAKLREVGFKTFSPYIDESYDEEIDNDKRFFMILDEVKRLCNMTKKEIHKWYYKMEDILIYNQEHFANYKMQDHKNVWNEISEIMYARFPIEHPDDLIDKLNNSNVPFLHGLGKFIFYDKNLDKIIIDISDESITEDIANQYEEFCKKNDIPISKTLVLHSNVILEREYSYSFDYFFIECKRLLNRSPDYGKIDYNIKKEKIYNCLNHSENKHRTIIFNGLKSRKLLKYGFVSYLDRGVYLPRKYKGTRRGWRWGTLLPDVVSKTYFNVVTETHHEIDKQYDDLFITEKTCKALITQPFIVVGNYGTLRHIKKLGFETYPELFDESYDLIENPKDRLEFILDEIERLCNMDKNKLEEIYESVLWKAENNKKRMLKFDIQDYKNVCLNSATLTYNKGAHDG